MHARAQAVIAATNPTHPTQDFAPLAATLPAVIDAPLFSQADISLLPSGKTYSVSGFETMYSPKRFRSFKYIFGYVANL